MALTTWLVDIWTMFLEPIIDAVIEGILSEICLCALWNLFESGCTNDKTNCGSKKRVSLQSPGVLDWPSTITYTWQLFAPDWPFPESFTGAWPPAHPCNARMVALASSASSLTMTTQEANEASYCLGMVVLYGNDTTPSYVTDSCAQLFETYLANNVAFTSLTTGEQAQAMNCISDRALIGGAKRGANGALDWVPTNLLSTSTGFPTIASNMYGVFKDGSSALEVQQQRNRDLTYQPYVLASSEYQDGLKSSYGTQSFIYWPLQLDVWQNSE
jgi:hypothetical protein